MYLRNSIICLLFPFIVNSQILTNVFTDPCTKKVTVFVVPLQGTTLVFMNKSKYITPEDVRSGALMQWVNQVYTEYAAPCPINQLTQQVTQQTVTASVASAVSAAAASAANTASAAASSVAASAASSVSVPVAAPASAPAPAPASQPASSQSSGSSSQSSSQSEGSSSSSSESKSEGGNESKSEEAEPESKSESKKEEKKESKKEEKKKSNAKAGQTPLIFSSDFSSVKQLDGDFNLMANLGVSRASMAGDVSYGSTLTIFSNLKQFALSTRYSKMDIQNGKLCGIGTMSYTLAYNNGDLLHIAGNSYVMMNKGYIYGYALSLINTSIPFEGGKQQFLTSSIVLFGMKPFQYSKRLGITPELFLMSSPLNYSFGSDNLASVSQLSYIIGSSFDIAISKRFKLSTNVKYMGPVHTIGLLIGTKFNL
jgi:hypothetical protein